MPLKGTTGFPEEQAKPKRAPCCSLTVKPFIHPICTVVPAQGSGRHACPTRAPSGDRRVRTTHRARFAFLPQAPGRELAGEAGPGPACEMLRGGGAVPDVPSAARQRLSLPPGTARWVPGACGRNKVNAADAKRREHCARECRCRAVCLPP
jgi:hypothetical protein